MWTRSAGRERKGTGSGIAPTGRPNRLAGRAALAPARWNNASGLPTRLLVPASTGPWLFSHGNESSSAIHVRNVRKLQWSHDISAMEISSWGSRERATMRRFNGTMTFQPWRCRTNIRLMDTIGSFNRVMAFQPWKSLAFCQIIFFLQASIGP